MKSLLTSELCGWPDDHVTVFTDPSEPGSLPDQLVELFYDAQDVALFYYVGHGQVDPQDTLCLGLVGSRIAAERRRYTSLPFDAVRYALTRSRAKVKIVILDCCYAGLAAQPTLSADDVSDRTRGTGAYTLAAAGEFARAWYETDPTIPTPQTFFTRYFVDVVEAGIVGEGPDLRLEPIFNEVVETLARDDKPEPTSRTADRAARFVFARNRAYRPPPPDTLGHRTASIPSPQGRPRSAASRPPDPPLAPSNGDTETPAPALLQEQDTGENTTSPPRRLGERYELDAIVGRGDMTEVYRARDLRLDRLVAVKTLRSDLATDHTFQVRFRREQIMAASLNDPSIPGTFDTGEDRTGRNPELYIVMEFVDGTTLREILRGDPRLLLPEQALELTDGILRALDYSHRGGIVHCGISPAHVMLTRNGDVKVIGFSNAQAMADPTATMARAAPVIGAVQYLSPEQARGERVDARSDIYSTGCVLYELLTGRPPFTGDPATTIADHHVREDLIPPSQLDPQIPKCADAIVLKATAKDPAQRYQNAGEMRLDIQRGMTSMPARATAVNEPPPPRPKFPVVMRGYAKDQVEAFLVEAEKSSFSYGQPPAFVAVMRGYNRRIVDDYIKTCWRYYAHCWRARPTLAPELRWVPSALFHAGRSSTDRSRR
jgi:serine/threonine protein kinase